MAEPLRWRAEAQTLHLSGELDQETVLALWPQRETVMKQIDTIDVADLQRVDSAGLAFLVHLCQISRQQGITLGFTGISDKLHSLITLYNLQQIMVSSATS